MYRGPPHPLRGPLATLHLNSSLTHPVFTEHLLCARLSTRCPGPSRRPEAKSLSAFRILRVQWMGASVQTELWEFEQMNTAERKAGPSNCSSSREAGTHSLPLLPQMDGPPAHVMKTQPCILEGLIRHISGSGSLRGGGVFSRLDAKISHPP